jgi:hypothetical protein
VSKGAVAKKYQPYRKLAEELALENAALVEGLRWALDSLWDTTEKIPVDSAPYHKYRRLLGDE